MNKIFSCYFLFLLSHLTSSLYFELKGDKEKCFVDEFYSHSVVVVKFDLYGVDVTDQSKTKILIHEDLKMIESIQIKYYKEEGNELISRHIVRSLNGKFSFLVEHTANYKICAQNIVTSWWAGKKIFMKLKFETDTTAEFNLDNAVKMEDVSKISEKINEIVGDSRQIIYKQHIERESEDASYNLQQTYSKTFIALTVGQILIVLLLGIYHLYSFKNFLISHHVI